MAAERIKLEEAVLQPVQDFQRGAVDWPKGDSPVKMS